MKDAESSDPMLEQRRVKSRSFIRLPAWITINASPIKEHVAFVRDISPDGIFFYSDFAPSAGEHIEFVLEYLKGNNRVRLHLSGQVVRLESTARKTTGVAVRFDSPREDVPRWPVRQK